MARQPRSGPSEEFLALSYHELKRKRRIRYYVMASVVVMLLLLLGWVLWRDGALAVLLSGKPSTDGPVPEVRYAWVQLLPDNDPNAPRGRLARAIVSGDRCPAIKEDDKISTMRRRPPLVRAAFPVLVCEAYLGANSVAQLGGRTLPARPGEPNDIVVIGDTGCRITYYSQNQSCLDGAGWPFRQNAASAAAKVSSQSFVLHLGDFHYREHPCADSSKMCGGSPYGDNWETWETEFFEPADPLLRVAPWVVLRGNHEDCNRAGAGWLFFFGLPDGKATDLACDSTPTGYPVTIGQTEEASPRPRVLLVLDTSDEKNFRKIKERCGQFLALLKPLDASGPAFWLAMHQPLWGRKLNGRADDASGKPCEETKSALTAIRDKFEARPNEPLARVVLSGDTHAFQFFQPTKGATPIQIIAGNGGTALDPLCEAATASTTATECEDKDGPDDGRNYNLVEKARDSTVKSSKVEGSSLTFVEHGFTILHRDRSTWTAIQFDSAGRKIVACQFSEATPTGASVTMADCGPFS